MDKIIEAARKQSTEMVLQCVRTIGGGHVEADHRMVRAALIEVYAERCGEDAADALMTELGM